MRMFDHHLDIVETPITVRVSRYWAPVLLYAAAIFYLSSFSHPEDLAPALFKNVGDKTLHMVEYAILGALSYRACRYAAGAWAARYAVLLAVAMSTLYGLTDELHQALVPFREADGWDLLTDFIGAAAGAWTWHRVNESPGDGETLS